jgi:hypothetical protein
MMRRCGAHELEDQVAVLPRFAHRDPSDRKLAHYRSDGLFEAVRRTTAASDVEN